MGNKTEKWYGHKIIKYFKKHYGKYEHTAEWFVNPSKNRWKCYIPDLELVVLFSCDDKGEVVEERLCTTQRADKPKNKCDTCTHNGRKFCIICNYREAAN